MIGVIEQTIIEPHDLIVCITRRASFTSTSSKTNPMVKKPPPRVKLNNIKHSVLIQYLTGIIYYTVKVFTIG